MTMLLRSLLKKGSPSTDKIVAHSMLTGDKSAALTYINAVLNTSTPELRAILVKNLNEILDGHSAMLAAAISNNWTDPYEDINLQLMDTMQQSIDIVGSKNQ